MVSTIFVSVTSAAYDAPAVTILEDGTIDPSIAAITKSDNKYTLTENITARIIIQKSNIIYDGAGYTTLGGIRIESDYVTVKNTILDECNPAILISESNHNTIENNSFYHVFGGITIVGDYNTIRANNLYSGLYHLIYVNGNYNTITQNYAYGIEIFSDSAHNVITENTLDYIADLGENNTRLNNTLDAFGKSPTPTPTIPELSTIMLSPSILILFGAVVIKLKKHAVKAN
jgi:parallel beta-helix repeat protein